MLDAVETSFDPVDSPRLACDLRLKMADLSHHMPHRGFERSDTRLELSYVRFNLIHHPSDVPQVLKDNVARLVSHTANLVGMLTESTRHYTASAPEMISISSLVIIAWRVRL